MHASSQRVLDIDPAISGADHEKIEPGVKVKPGPPSHALLEIGDELTSSSELMDEGQQQQSAGLSALSPPGCISQSIIML